MGLGSSRNFPISYEDACARAGEDQFARLNDTFHRLSSNNYYLPQVTFVKDVLGDNVPAKLAEALYHACGGGPKGISFKDTLCGLVLLTNGSKEEKAKLIAALLSEDGEYIQRDRLVDFVRACDGVAPRDDLKTLFTGEPTEHPECSVENFTKWIQTNHKMASFSQWLLDDDNRVFTLGGEGKDPPTFHQTLAALYNLDEQDVMSVEKTYWSLRGADKCSLNTFEQYTSPLLPKELCASLFRVFDNNCDGHIDLEEMVRGVAMCCRRTEKERHELCFDMFDEDKDGTLSKDELTRALGFLKTISNSESTPTSQPSSTNAVTPGLSSDTAASIPNTISGDATPGSPDLATPCPATSSEPPPVTTATSPLGDAAVLPAGDAGSGSTDAGAAPDPGYDAAAILLYYKTPDGHLTKDDYVKWALLHPWTLELLNLLVQICHIRLGIRPKDSKVEAMAVGGYLQRFRRRGLHPGDTVYLLDAQWFRDWCSYTGYQPGGAAETGPSPGHSHKAPKQRKHKKSKPSKAQKSHASSHPTNGMVRELDAVAGPNSSEPSLSGSELNLAPPKPGNQPKPGPIDNSALCVPEILDGNQKKLPSLTNEGGLLKRASPLVEGQDFVLLTEEIWKVFTLWYGTADTTFYGPSLPRKVSEDGQLELYPVLFKIYRHSNQPLNRPGGMWQTIQGLFGGGANAMATPISGNGDVPGAVAPPPPKRTLYYQAAFNKKTTIKEISERMQQLLHVRGDEVRIHDLTDIDHPRLLDNESDTVEALQFQDMQKLLVETRNRDNTWPEEMISLVNDMKAKGGKGEPQPQTQPHDVVPGAVGLGNLGNTCFMNSALQCVSNAQPLTKYFRDREHLLEINKENPLGKKGVIAKRYAELVEDLWNSNAKSITPLKFRFTVARYATQFEGFQQQDAQELLAFVLDGLHEDLNRVKVKPYMELKDSDGRDDAEVAKEGWDYHRMRNNSIIVDLFQGQLKSVVRCRECDYQSVRFDPFTFLSLPLSFESTVGLEVIVVRLDSSQPVKYGLRVELESSYVALKEKLTQLVGIQLPRIHLVEVACSTVKATLVDTTKIRSILGGWLYAYETPEPPPLQPTPRADSPDEQARVSKVRHLKHERTMSMNQSKGLREAAKLARANRELKEQNGLSTMAEDREGTPAGAETPGLSQSDEGREAVGVGSVTAVPEISVHAEEGLSVPSSPDPVPATASNDAGSSAFLAPIVEPPVDVTAGTTSVVEPPVDTTAGTTLVVEPPVDTSAGATSSSPMGPPTVLPHTSMASQPPPVNIVNSGFVFAVHRRTYAVHQYFASCNKIKKALFGIPLLVPCHVGTPHNQVYETVWQRCQRLLIPDPPSAKTRATSGYPFKLVKVHKDGLVCDSCPWYKFCQGCPIDCDDHPIGSKVALIGIDWDTATLNLKYQQALERPLDHESLASLKTLDVSTIDLATCFKSFVREDNLGEDERWYCKRCQKQQLATKSLEIWRFPPILIIHLKRFQFFNGHWIKSQQMVKFPMEGLNPMEYKLNSNKHATATKREHLEDSTGGSEAAKGGASRYGEVAHGGPGGPLDGNNNATHMGQSCEVTIETRPEEGETKMAEGLPDEGKAEVTSPGSNGQGMVSDVKPKEGTVSSGPEVEGNAPTKVMTLDGPGKADDQHGMGTVEPEPLKEGMGVGGATAAAETTGHNGESDANKVYDLFAVSIHTGVLGGGHYTSVAKNPNGKWYYYNDSSCKETTAERVCQECPYMLFYEMRGLDSGSFRAKQQGKKEDIGNTEDDMAFEETTRHCVVS